MITIITYFVLSFMISNTKFQKMDDELSRRQIIAFENINNKLFLVTYERNLNAKLDILNLDNLKIENDILKNHSENVSYNSILYRDKNERILIGDVNKLLVLGKDNSIINLYQDYALSDSTYFEIEAFTEGDNNIYFLKRNFKMIIEGEENGTSFKWGLSEVEIVKLDSKGNLNVIGKLENVIAPSNDIYYFKNKLYCSFFNKKKSLIEIDLENYKQKIIDIKEVFFSELKFENFDFLNIEKIFEFKDFLYLYAEIFTEHHQSFKCFIRINTENYDIKSYSLKRDNISDLIEPILSFEKYDGKIICTSSKFESKKFYNFDGDKFEEIFFEFEKSPLLFTSNSFKEVMKTNNDRYTYEYNTFDIDKGLLLDKNGNLFGGTNGGLVVIENFLQPTSSAEINEFEIKTLPDLSNVKNELYIESEFNINSYKVFDINSKTIQTKSNLNSNNLNLNLEGLTIGIYFIEINTQKGIKILKFIKN